MKTGYENIIRYVDPRLARYVPKDFDHVAKHPLTAAIIETLPPVPITAGVNWYSNFDTPVKDRDGKWWVGRGDLGRIRGGHAVCIPARDNDTYNWYLWYNQIMEGSCVGQAGSRMMSLMNRVMYQAKWLWNEAKKIDEWAETNPGDNEGTSVRAALDVLRAQGHVRKTATLPVAIEGIHANKWARTIDQCNEVLQNDRYKQLGAFPFHNSWGKSYPQKVWMPCETWQRLMNEYGEFTMVTDR